ncbi:MAG: DUF2752 domain-containing protein [Phycisphaerae bacterium]|nr:DUF2752 domain-containing protein [Phycisphaerae bacterium]
MGRMNPFGKDNSPVSPETTPKGRIKIRLCGLVVGLVCLGAIVVAATLSPRGDGYGTHTRLGLSGCGFLARTGYPCPGCGVTTAVAAMSRGQVVQALRAHLFGVLLVLAAAGFALLGFVDAITARGVLRKCRPRLWWTWVALLSLLLGWGLKVGVGLLTGQYPLWK